MKTRLGILSFIFLLLAQFSNGALKEDFKIKGFHIDLRCEVMTMPALKTFAKDLSGMGINALLMEWEGTYPYTKHATLSNKYAYSKDEIKSFVSYCESIGIKVIPLQNCFGHSEYILRHERYKEIREDAKEVSQVCPSEIEKSKVIFKEIFAEIAELHPSEYFHIGCDETYLLGSCKKCAAKVKQDGNKSKLFVDYVNEMCQLVKEMGKKPIIWADILLHHPEAATKLNKDVIIVNWNYGWDINRFGNVDTILNKGFTFWGSPALRSYPDNIYLTEWQKHFENLKTFIPYMRKANYKGIINTSWSTSGTYGFLYDTNWEVVDMYPIRYVYPLSGFRILVAAFAASLQTQEPLDYGAFIIKYAQERFGFTAAQSKVIMDILYMSQPPVREIQSEQLSTEKAKFIEASKTINALKPIRNIKEFQHLQLMTDMRVQYLRFKEVEAKFQSTSFNRSQAADIKKELYYLIVYAEKLNQRFLKLNAGYLYDEELKEMNVLRNKKMMNLYDVVNRMTAQK
ncbi:glycosyl hydrolase family 20 [Bacteroides zoogleoformans]|uniref:Glycoside hydrolase n=1 Tax=Bacteroides zoogleoformans TaxID=28119 RepID=A0ABN5IMK3_9BACE|nr:DUF4838 domain-containing protein [Bacteroides zoogleoformans]AVM54072.1 glycoside hydrolase [Bacteroides zoogleoformans]TWJ17830.1 glycosyl hydrolase family 20 [Bacteroides zoogleoformans]